MIRLGTLFSGIGAIEQALLRMNLKHSLVFACDNGELDLKLLPSDEQNEYDNLKKITKKNVTEEESRRLYVLRQKEEETISKIAHYVSQLPSIHDKKTYVDNLYETHSKGENHVKQTYLANYDINEDDFHLDIRFLDGTDYYDKENPIDLIVGGSPCQAFSDVGAQHGLNDTRGTLFYEFARIIKETQPKVFIYENVRGLTTHDNGRTWKIMRNVFENDLNYKIAEPQVLNASDYGIPQTRRRLFVIGIREDIECEPFVYPEVSSLQYTMQDFLEDNCAYGHFNYDKKDGKLIVEKFAGSPDKKFTLTSAVQKYVLAGGTSNYKTSTETDLPIARTLMKMMTQHHRAGVDNYITVQKDPLVLRQLSDREALRLMGYPDTFKIAVSSMQTLRQAGNSIVVDVMMSIVKQIVKTGVFNK